ncbi:uncharacterized protein LOC119738718 [Patiria miniata]|uniref:Uncharacterized protein n=1 Tax=Patiria miniata TaxID=46514 RepID=A0A914B0R4_PATMI|nr:uncharacterized protein LOC119738718 [Patiria miniata]
MYAAVLFSVLIVAASAVGEEPEKCCSDPYYTFIAEIVATELKEGALLTELIQQPGAYDSIDKKIGLKYNVHISNGTQEAFRLIADYNEGKAYVIYKEEEETKCDIYTFSYGFPYNCVPEDSKFAGSVTIGDRAIRANNWYHNDQSSPSEDVHTVYTIEEEECVDVSSFQRTFDPETGDEISLVRSTYSDFSLGICHPDDWFKVPEECQAGRAKMVEGIPKKYAGLRGPGGKRLFQ